jgi:hypothetical protein
MTSFGFLVGLEGLLGHCSRLLPTETWTCPTVVSSVQFDCWIQLSFSTLECDYGWFLSQRIANLQLSNMIFQSLDFFLPLLIQMKRELVLYSHLFNIIVGLDNSVLKLNVIIFSFVEQMITFNSTI